MILQFLANGLVAGAVYALVALGFALVFTSTRIFHFAHGGIYVMATFIGYATMKATGLGLPAGFLAAAGSGALLGVAVNRVLYEPMRAGGVSSFVMMISSFGVLVILTNLVSMIWGSNPAVLPHMGGSVWRLGPVFITQMQVQILAIVLVLALGLVWFFGRTRLGIALRALGSDSELAEVMGMPAVRLRDTALAVSSALAGVGGLLIGLDVGIIDFNMGLQAILMATIAMIVGGLGNVGAAAGGALVLGLIQNLAVWQISSKWQIAISFAVLTLILLFRPQGIFGEKRRVA